MFVLRRYDSIPRTGNLFCSYEEVVNTTVTNYNNKLATTLFLNTVTARDLALKQGWQDESEEYNKHLEAEQEIVDSKKLEDFVATIEIKKVKKKNTNRSKKKK